MTITIDLPPDTLAALHAAAAEQGRSVEELVAEGMTLLYAPEDDLADACAGIAEGLAQMDAGRGRPFGEFAAEFSARFAEWHGLPLP